MKTKEMINVLYFLTLSAGTVMAIEYGLYLKRKNEKIQILSDKINLDISDPIIKAGIDRAIEREVTSKIDKAARETIREVKSDMKKLVKAEVDDEFSDIKDQTKRELKKQIGNVDIDRIRREFIEENKRYAAEKFKEDLDDILEKHNEELENVTKIYSSIADKLSE